MIRDKDLYDSFEGRDETRTYSELIKLTTFEGRYEYLKLDGDVGVETFGSDRYLNQMFYTSDEWRAIRDQVIIRDNGCDLGVEGYEIEGPIYVHHINAITPDDILQHSTFLVSPQYLICCSKRTHDAIHYGDRSLLPRGPIQRIQNDTCPWKKKG